MDRSTYGNIHMKSLIVFIYRNLNAPGVCYSVRDTTTNRVILHTSSIIVKNVKFVIQKGGQRKVRFLKRKQVHAGIRGEMVICPDEINSIIEQTKTRIYYDPYINDNFVNGSNEPVSEAKFAYLTSHDGKSCVLI